MIFPNAGFANNAPNVNGELVIILAEHICDQLGDRLARLEQDITCEAIGNDDIGFTVEQFFALYIADKV